MSGLFEKLFGMTLSRRTVAWVMAVLFVLSLIPLVLIAVYNYPADDDFGFAIDAVHAWLHTGSLWKVARAIFDKTVQTYHTWQGDFVSTALFGVSPIIFNIDLYFLSNWFTLALLCLSAGYLLKGVVCLHLRASKSAFWIVYVSVMTLVLQFMPGIGWSVFWHNGGIYTVTVCFLALLLGVLTRCALPMTCTRSVVRGVLAALLGFLLGGSFYGPMLGALVLLFLIAIAALCLRQRHRWHALAALGGLAVSLVISVTAPGNALRQAASNDPLSPLPAILISVLDSFDLTGQWLTPQLLAALLLILPVLYMPLKNSRFRFRHPIWVCIALYGLFSASLVPGVYTQASYDTYRYLNAIYMYFLIFAVASAIYVEGAVIRCLERRDGADRPAARETGSRFCALYLCGVLLLGTLGAFGHTLFNTSSLSAAKSLLNGEATRFRQEMKEREAYILQTPTEALNVEPLSGQPYVFKQDRLPFQGVYGRLLYMKYYYELFDMAERGEL